MDGAEGECACGSESWVVKRSYMGTAEVSFSTLPSHTSTIRPTKPPTPLPTPAALHCTVFFSACSRGCQALILQDRCVCRHSKRWPAVVYTTHIRVWRQSSDTPPLGPNEKADHIARHCFSKPLLHEAGRQRQRPLHLHLVCRSNNLCLCSLVADHQHKQRVVVAKRTRFQATFLHSQTSTMAGQNSVIAADTRVCSLYSLMPYI